MSIKKLPDPSRTSIGWGSFNPDLSAGDPGRREKTNQDFTKNSDPGGDDKAFPTTSDGLHKPEVHPSANDTSLIKVFTK